MELDTVTRIIQEFYRRVGMNPADPGLGMQGESKNEVALILLTRGFRAAQRWLVDNGGQSLWRKRSEAVTWEGSEEADGGRHTDLPDDFLRLWGDRTRTKSALVEPDGRDWGHLIDEEQSNRQGPFYYLRGDQLWITRGARPPMVVHIEYHHRHPPLTEEMAAAAIDFPEDLRPLAIAEATVAATGESWFSGGSTVVEAIVRNREEQRQAARRIVRRTREARRMAPPPRHANHW